MADAAGPTQDEIAGRPMDELMACLAQAKFDPQKYTANNAPLQKLSFTEAEAQRHFLTTGYQNSLRAPAEAFAAVLPKLLSLDIADQHYRRDIIRALLLGQRDYTGTKRRIAQAYTPAQHAAFQDMGARPFLLIGDSHSTAYYLSPETPEGWLLPIHLDSSGGSAGGLANKKSKSGYGSSIEKWSHGLAASFPTLDMPVLFKFGGVDAEFVWNFQRIRDNVTSWSLDQFSDFAEKSTAQYLGFIAGIAKILPPRLIHIVSIFPPCLSDSRWAEGYVNGHIGYLESDQAVEDLRTATKLLQIPDLATRTTMHGIYNNNLRRGAAALGVHFMDDFTPLLDDGGKTIAAKYFLRHGGRDHHIDSVAARPLLSAFISSCFSA